MEAFYTSCARKGNQILHIKLGSCALLVMSDETRWAALGNSRDVAPDRFGMVYHTVPRSARCLSDG